MKYFVIYFSIFIVIFLLYKLYFYIRVKNNVKKRIIEEQYLECRHKIKIKKSKNFILSFLLLIL